MAITLGNSKIGKTMTWTWSMPPGVDKTCPGESDDCRVHCYAKKGFLGAMPSVTKAQQQNYEFSMTEHFPGWMTLEIHRVKAKLFRIHVVGDFYDADYIQKWIKIVQACPDTTFYAYTRSWNIPELRPWIDKLAKLPNLRMWWSCDRAMPTPQPPEGTRLAYMQVEANDVPKYKTDLVFRVKALRKSVIKKVNNSMVCPPENGASKNVTCEKCGWCWKPLYQQELPKAEEGRVALPVLA